MQLLRQFQILSFPVNCHRPPTGSVFQEHMAGDASRESYAMPVFFIIIILFLFLDRRGQQDAKPWGRKVSFGFVRRRI